MTRIGWRSFGLAGAAIGLGASSYAFESPAERLLPVSLALLTGFGLAGVGVLRRGSGSARLLATIAALAGCCLVGLVVGKARVEAIASGAARIPPGLGTQVEGTITSWSVETDGSRLILLSTPDGRLGLLAPAGSEPEVGRRLRATGRSEAVPEWRSDWFERHGVRSVVAARRVEFTGQERGGISGAVDSVRINAEESLGVGMRPVESALARGFVLGQDQTIPSATEDEFRRSGLSHLLAVSGQNVVLLSILAWPFLAMIGLGLRGRLVATAGLIAFYVLVTGAGPSIQRAGIMGLVALSAGLAGRPAIRLHSLLLAAVSTLAINPLSVGDPGWLLSFAATAGIMAWALPLARTLGAWAGAGEIKRSLVEAVAVTTSATLATAPLGAAIFGTFSLAALPANLAVLPAVAPAMWLGMLSASLGQLSEGFTVPFNWVNARCLGFIEQVANSFSAPSWATVQVEWFPPAMVVASWLVTAALVFSMRSYSLRRDGLGAGRRLRAPFVVAGVLLSSLLLIPALFHATGGGGPNRELRRLAVCALDIGQGDAILLDPPGPDAALVDTGPPGNDVLTLLRERGVSSLTSLILTHDQSDHTGMAAALMGSLPVQELVFGSLDGSLKQQAIFSGVELRKIAEGGEIRVGQDLRLSVLWPPRALLSGAAGDPNDRALVLLASWHHFTALLPADAESGSVPIDAGPVDLLKVSHHGSEDPGLDSLLEHSAPKLAVISVGEENPYGHPTDRTLSSLSDHQVPTLRTDLDGSVGATVGLRSWRGGEC